MTTDPRVEELNRLLAQFKCVTMAEAVVALERLRAGLDVEKEQREPE